MRRRLSKYCALERLDRRVVVEALFLLAVVRVLVWTAPFRVVRRLRVGARCGSGVEAARLVLGLERAASGVPCCTCLVRAIAGQWLLARHGYESRVRIGVARKGAEFSAHAWLECEAGVVMGGSEGEFRVLEGALAE